MASLSHPCFDVSVSSSGWVVERVGFETTIFRKISHYRRVFEHWIPWRGEADQEWCTPAYHRPLSWYFRTLCRAGFVVSAFEEPEPTDEFMAEDPQGVDRADPPPVRYRGLQIQAMNEYYAPRAPDGCGANNGYL